MQAETPIEPKAAESYPTKEQSMCRQIEPNEPPTGCIWGQYCFGTICAGGPQTLACENLGGGNCFTCAIGLVGHNGDVDKVDEAARTIFRLHDSGRAEVRKADGEFSLKVGTLVLSINGWPANAITFVALEHLKADEIEWRYLEPGTADVTTRMIARQ